MTLFTGDRPALIHPQLLEWCPALLRRVGARPFSESIRASFIPTNQSGVSENHPKTLLYRRALAIVAGLETPATPAAASTTPPTAAAGAAGTAGCASAQKSCAMRHMRAHPLCMLSLEMLQGCGIAGGDPARAL